METSVLPYTRREVGGVAGMVGMVGMAGTPGIAGIAFTPGLTPDTPE